MGCQCSKYDSSTDISTDLVSSYSDLVKEQTHEYPILIYSRVHCPHSAQVKDLLRVKQFKFEYFELDNMNEGEQIQALLQAMTGKKRTPYVFVEGEYIGGLQELATYFTPNLNLASV